MDQNPEPTPDPSPSRELAISPQSASRDLAVTSLRLLPAGTGLGITVARLTGYITRYRLNAEQVSTLVVIRRDYKASVPAMMRLYAQGLSIEQIELVYGVREALKLNHGDAGGQPASIGLLWELIDAFGLDDLEAETIADEITTAHEEISNGSEWIRHIWQSIQIMLQVAASFPGIAFDSAVNMASESDNDEDDGSLPED